MGHPIRYAVMVVRLRQWDGAAGLAKELLALAAFAQHDAHECCQLAEAGNAHAAQALAQIGVLGAKVLTLERELLEGLAILQVRARNDVARGSMRLRCAVSHAYLNFSDLSALPIRRLRQRP